MGGETLCESPENKPKRIFPWDLSIFESLFGKILVKANREFAVVVCAKGWFWNHGMDSSFNLLQTP